MRRTVRLVSLLLVLLLGGVWAYAWVSRAPGEGLAEAFAARIGRLFGAEMPVPSAGGGAGVARRRGRRDSGRRSGRRRGQR